MDNTPNHIPSYIQMWIIFFYNVATNFLKSTRQCYTILVLFDEKWFFK